MPTDATLNQWNMQSKPTRSNSNYHTYNHSAKESASNTPATMPSKFLMLPDQSKLSSLPPTGLKMGSRTASHASFDR